MPGGVWCRCNADLDVGLVTALQALDKADSHMGGQVWVLPIGLATPPPSGVPEDVDVGPKAIQAPAAPCLTLFQSCYDAASWRHMRPKIECVCASQIDVSTFDLKPVKLSAISKVAYPTQAKVTAVMQEHSVSDLQVPLCIAWAVCRHYTAISRQCLRLLP